MGTYGYISCIALFCYVFMLLLMLAARRNKIANSFLILLIAMICWTGGSLFMRNLIWPGYRFWYHVSLSGCLPALWILSFYYGICRENEKKRKYFLWCAVSAFICSQCAAWIFAGTAGAGEDG